MNLFFAGKTGWAGACAVLSLVSQLCPTPCDPMKCSPPGSSVHGDCPGKNTGVGCPALLQGISPTQGSNLGLLHGRWILYHLCYQGSLHCISLLFHVVLPQISLRILISNLLCELPISNCLCWSFSSHCGIPSKV